MATLLKPAPTRIDVTPQPMPALSDRPIDGSSYWSGAFMDREWDRIWKKALLIGGLGAVIPIATRLRSTRLCLDVALIRPLASATGPVQPSGRSCMFVCR